MHKIKYYYQNLETKPGSTQDEVLAGTVDKLATLWAPDSVVYRLFVQRCSSKDHNVETTMHPQHYSNLIDLITPNQISPQRMQSDRARHVLRPGLLAVLLSIAFAVPVMAAPVQLPAIVEPAKSIMSAKLYLLNW